MANKQSRADVLIGKVKRVAGYAGVFGVAGFFLLPLVPIVAITGTVAVLIGVGSGAAVAVKTDKK